MSVRTLACFAAFLACGACTSRTSPGPIHRCMVANWIEYEDVCTCDPQPLTGEEVEREVVDEGTMVGLFAPPGSLPPGAAVVITHGGATSEAAVAPDGSLATYVRNGGGYDLRGRHATVQVAGATYTVVLDVVRAEVEWGPAGVDPRFSAHDVAIEDPVDTIAVSARLEASYASATPIEHFAVLTSLYVVDWLASAPAIGDVVTWTGPGQEGDPIGFVALHDSGAASGCYVGGVGGRCGCSVARREAGRCRLAIHAEQPDGGTDGHDAGFDHGSLPDAGSPEAGPPQDAGEPF